MAEDNTRDFPRENLVRAVMDGGVEFREPARAADGADAKPNDGRLGTLYGRFTPLGDWTEINSSFEGNFMERFSDGSLRKTVKENTGMRVLFQHGRDPQIGSKPLGPVESLSADSSYVVKLVDTSYNRDLLPLLKEGVLGASFQFNVVKEEWRDNPGVSEYNPKGLPERTVTEARVMEFGPVTFPAYAGASAGVRSLTDEFRQPLTTADVPANLAPEPDPEPEVARDEEIPEPAVVATPEVKDDEPRHSRA